MQNNQLPEENGHVVSYSVHGNPKGPSIVSFHGGPGSCSKPQHVERFDLGKYQVVLFDQRGSGASTPLGKLEHNTTQAVLSDAERIREALGIEKWFVSGGSWGSTCALLYAIAHPERTQGMLLSAIYLGDKETDAWMMDEGGVALLMPDVWEKRTQFFSEFSITIDTQHEDILHLLSDANPEVQKRVTAGLMNWEGNLFSPYAKISYIALEDVTEKMIASAKIFTHYQLHHHFIPEGYILDSLEQVKNIPTVIVHGRYDILCPLDKAHVLTKSLSDCDLIIATSSGHSLTPEAQMIQYLAYDRFLSVCTD